MAISWVALVKTGPSLRSQALDPHGWAAASRSYFYPNVAG